MTVRTVLTSCLLLGGFASAGGAQSLPGGTGRDVVTAACTTACHGAATIANARHSRAEWQHVVDDMIARGARVSPGDIPVVIAYLAEHLGRDVAGPAITPAEPPHTSSALAVSHVPVPAHGAIDWRTAGRNFPTVGGNDANQRYSSLKQIDSTNVTHLGGAWVVHLGGGRPVGNMQATPVVIDGIMYVSTGTNDIFAIDAATGTLRWRYTSDARVGNTTNRGVVVAEGRVFSGQRDNSLVALDQRTGALVWKTQLAPPGVGYTTAPAAYYDGRVYIGVAGGESGVRGQFGAYDAKTGKEIWRFWTLPGPGEKGHDTWEGDSWAHGGGPIWTQPAIDPDLGAIYFAVGNAGPDNDGTERGGDNLFTSSIVALDLKTGAYKWHFQEVHHDLWDYDNSAAPLLADVTVRGVRRKVLVHAGKTGFVYILDRTNGTPLVGIEERPVPQEPRMKTASTQPFPVGDAVVPTCPEPGSVPPQFASSCIFGAYWTTPIVMTPGTLGGVSWAPLAFSPITGLVYVPASIINSAFGLRRERWDPEAQRLKGIDEGTGFFRPAGEPRAGTLTALDPTTNRIVWQKRTKFPIGTGSGLLSTAGGLLFHGEPDGNIVAYDIRNGESLWRFQTGAGADAPVATYEVNGEQYVAILAGGNSFQLSARGDSLWAFKLGGTVAPAAAPPEPPLRQPGTTQPVRPAIAQQLTFTPYHATGIYEVGETVGWTVTPGPAQPTYAYKWSIRRNNAVVLKEGTLDLSSGKDTIEIAGDQPEMIYVAIQGEGNPPVEGGNAGRNTGFYAVGAAVAPRKIGLSTPRPGDFDAFWDSKLAAQAKIPIHPVLTPVQTDVADVTESMFELDALGSKAHGYLAKPSREGKFPAVIQLQYAGVYALNPGIVSRRAAEGWLALDVDSHDKLPSDPSGNVPRAYQAVGNTDRETSYFLNMYLRDSRVLDYLLSRPDWDGKTIVLMGGSMGGQQSLALAGLRPDKISAVLVCVPAGADTNGDLHGRKAGYPNWPSDNPDAMRTALYFDTVNFAPRITAPTFVGMGFIDTISPPAGVWTMVNQIRGPVEVLPMIDSEHDNLTADKGRPCPTRTNEILDSIVHGGTFVPKVLQ